MFMYVCMYVCMSVCLYVCMYIYVGMYICKLVCKHCMPCKYCMRAITTLLNEKHRLHYKQLSTDGPAQIAAEQAFKEVQSSLQYEIRHMKNKWRS